jgi:hypothetical protein
MLTSWGKAGLLLGFTLGNLVVAEDIITSDASFYGQSPAVYPSRTSNIIPYFVSPLLATRLGVTNPSSS